MYMFSSKRLKDAVVCVTGAARGIGYGIAKECIDEGARVILTDILDDVGTVSAQRLGRRAAYMHLDVSSEDKWVSALEGIVKEYGRLDVLVNNAGIIGSYKHPDDETPEYTSLDEWRRVHSINLDSVFLGCKHAIRVMKKTGGGSIVNMSSRSGLVGVPGAAAYSSSKAGIRNYTKTVALYCAQKGYNIRCNAVFPAAIETPMWDTLLGTDHARDEKQKDVVAGIPLGRMGTPRDVACAVVYLASADASYITGAELVVDGGVLAGSAASPQKK
jgi:3(or 17)beta-hydroxysteroid dehydrogenase